MNKDLRTGLKYWAALPPACGKNLVLLKTAGKPEAKASSIEIPKPS